MTLIANRWQTPDGTILWSKHRHDFVKHKDRVTGETMFVDGGNEYIRSSGVGLKNLCIYSDGTFELEREWVLWGKNYDKDMNRLEKTEWIPIKDLDSDHIYKILELNIPDSYRRLMEEEIIYRCELIEKQLNIPDKVKNIDMDNIEKATDFAEECMNDLKKVIHSPLTYTEVGEDGSRTLSYSYFGQKIFDILYDNFKKHLENDCRKNNV